MIDKQESLKALQQIPGVGKAVANDLWRMGIRAVGDLKGKNAEELYVLHNDERGEVQDICMLYTFRCAIYFANTVNKVRDPEKLKWWNWMDEVRVSSVEKDRLIREKFDRLTFAKASASKEGARGAKKSAKSLEDFK